MLLLGAPWVPDNDMCGQDGHCCGHGAIRLLSVVAKVTIRVLGCVQTCAWLPIPGGGGEGAVPAVSPAHAAPHWAPEGGGWSWTSPQLTPGGPSLRLHPPPPRPPFLCSHSIFAFLLPSRAELSSEDMLKS